MRTTGSVTFEKLIETGSLLPSGPAAGRSGTVVLVVEARADFAAIKVRGMYENDGFPHLLRACRDAGRIPFGLQRGTPMGTIADAARPGAGRRRFLHMQRRWSRLRALPRCCPRARSRF